MQLQNAQLVQGGAFCEDKYRKIIDVLFISAIAFTILKDTEGVKGIFEFLSGAFVLTSGGFVAAWTAALAAARTLSLDQGAVNIVLSLATAASVVSSVVPVWYSALFLYYSGKTIYRSARFVLCTTISTTVKSLNFVVSKFFRRRLSEAPPRMLEDKKESERPKPKQRKSASKKKSGKKY